MNVRLIVLLLSLQFFNIRAIVKGSNTLPSLESNFTFPEDVGIFGPNEIRGFAWFKDGFSLENSDTDLIYNAVFPVSGVVDLNGGTLTLQADLAFQDDATLTGLGFIEGANHSINLCSSITSFPADTQEFNDTKIFLQADLTINSAITFAGESLLCGKGNVLTLAPNSEIIIPANSQLTLRDLEIRGITSDNIRATDGSSLLILDNVKWIQDSNVEFSAGSILFKNRVDILGTSTFAYSSMQTSTIEDSACLYINSGMHLCMGRTLHEPLFFESDSSCLYLDNCSFSATTSGISFTNGIIRLARDITFDSLGTTTQTGLILGDGSPAHDITVYFEPGAAVVHTSGYWVYNNSRKDLLKSSSKSSRMIRNIGSKIYVPRDLEIDDITVQLNSKFVSPIQVESTAKLSYKNASVRLPDIDFDITSDQLNAYTYLLNGGDSLFLNKGVLPLHVQASGTENNILGNGGLAGAISLLNSDAELILGINGYVDNLVLLNGGTCLLGYDVLFRRNAQMVGPGYVNLAGNRIDFTAGFTANTPIYWQANKGEIGINGKVTLMETWTIDGDCRIIGNNSLFVLGQGGNIVLKEGSKLMLKNIPVQGVSGNNIRCLDDQGVISFMDADIDLSGDYLFDRGSMWFIQNTSISGAYTFSYDSAMTSTIRSDSSLIFTGESTLAIGKRDGITPLIFESRTSELEFLGANLRVLDGGMQILKGTVIVDGRVNLDILGTTTSSGLIVGDGTSADNDAQMILNPGMAVSHNSGYWVYNNVLPDRIKSASSAARLIRNSGSKIYLPKNLYVKNFTIELTSLLTNPIEVDPSAAISYFQAFVKMPIIEFDLSCSQLNAYTYYLSGGDTIFITKGILPLYILVQGTDNSLIGNGSLSGGVTFADDNSTLICGLGGFIDNFIMLNGSTFILSEDIKFDGNATINGPGVVDLGNNKLTFPINPQSLTTPIYWMADGGAINVRSAISLSSTWTFKGKCKISGINSKFMLSNGAQIVVDSDSELVLENLQLHGIHDENLRCLDNTAKITLVNTNLVQSGDTRFAQGSLEMYLKNSLSGAYTFSYDSIMTSTIKTDASLLVKNFTIMVAGRNNGNEPICLEKNSSMEFRDSTFRVKETGMQLTRGKIVADRDLVVDIMGTNSSTGLLLGDGIEERNMELMLNPGATARFPRGFVQYNITSPNGIRSTNKSAQLIRGANSIFDLKQNLNLGSMTVDVNLYAQLTIDPGKLLSYTDGRIVLPQGTFDLTGIRYNDFTTLLNGNGKLVLINGDMPLATLVSGVNNTIEGGGSVTGPIILSNSAAELSFNLNGYLFGNITLSGGTIILNNDIYLANGVLLIGNGTVQTGANNFEFGKVDLDLSGNILWDMDGGSIRLYSSIDLDGTWTFRGNAEIKGYGQTLNINQGNILIEDGAKLTISGIQIEGINNQNLRCLGDEAVLVLDGVMINQHNNHFTFDTGALRIQNKVCMYGDGIFAYESNQTSTICYDSSLNFDSGFTFSYYPAVASANLFEFQNNSSLVLNTAALHAASTGLQFTKGIFDIRGKSHLFIEEVQTEDEFGQISYGDNGLVLGDHNSTRDMRFIIRGGSTLMVHQGSLIYNNASLDSFFAENDFSTIKLQESTRLRAHENLDLGIGRIIMKQSAILEIEDGKDITGTILIE